MSEQLKHIFEGSACLSKRQLHDYAAGTMSREEQYAVEHHVTGCFFCSEALDGMSGNEALTALDTLNANFLKEHFSLLNPQIHLNSMAPSVAISPQRPTRKKINTQPFLKPSSIVAALVLGFGILWYMEFDKETDIVPQNAAQQTEVVAKKQNAIITNKKEQENNFSPQVNNTVKTESKTSATNENNSQPQRPQALVATQPETGKKKNIGDSTVKENATAENKSQKDIDEKPQPLAKLPSKNINTEASPDLTKNDKSIRKIETRKSSATNGNDKPKSEVEKGVPESHPLEKANDLYRAEKYRSALSYYKKQMNATGNSEEQFAMLQAAKCYVNLGQKKRAVNLLQSLAENGSGSSKRQAKRILRDLTDANDE